MSATAVNLGRTMVRIRDLVLLIDARPAGAKLDFAALIRALTPSQGDLIAAVQELVNEGALDPATLRALAKQSSPRSPRQKGEPGCALLAEIEAFCLRTGMAVSRFGKDAVNDFSLVNRLRKGARVTQATIARVRDFIAAAACPDATAAPAVPRPGHGGVELPNDRTAPPPGRCRMPDMEPEESPQSTLPPAPTDQERAAALSKGNAIAPAKSAEETAESAPPPAPVIVCPPSRELPEAAVPRTADPEARPGGRELADELSAYAERHSLSLHRVGRFLFNGPGAIGRLRAAAAPRRSTIDKVRAFLASPPPLELVAQPAGGPRVADVGGVTGAELAAQVDAVIEKHGLSKTRVGLHLYNNRCGVAVLRQSSPRRSTVERVRAFLANPPLAELGSRAPLGDRRFAENRAEEPSAELRGPTGVELADEIDAFVARSGVKAGRVSNLLFTSGTGIAQLRRVKQPKPETVAKVRLFLERPPAELFAPRRSFNTPPRAPASAKSKRDVTSKPETPLMDLADRQRLNGQRHFAEIRRGQERSAAALLDAGVEPGSVKSSYTANAMRQIQQRREDDARQQDPVEQAKLALRKRYTPVCSMAVHGGDPALFMVGSRRNLTRAELIELADKVGGSANGDSANQQRRVG